MKKQSVIDKFIGKVIRWLLKEEPPSRVPICDFEKIRYEIRPCDVLLIEGRSRVSRVIKNITQSPWSHSALYIGRLHDIEDPVLRQRVSEYFQGGDEEQLIIEGMLGEGTIISSIKDYQHDHIRICRPQGISRIDAQHVIGYGIAHLGTGYDVRQVLDLARLLFPWSFLPRRWRSSLFEHNAGDQTRTICSSLIAEAFGAVRFPILPSVHQDKEAGVKIVPKSPRLFTPRDFDYSPYFQIIKYPIFELSSTSTYRNLPWSEWGVVSDDEGNIIEADKSSKDNTENVE